MRKKNIVCGSIVLFAVLMGVVAMMMSNPLRKPPEKIREDLLKLTPIGTSMEEVIGAIRGHKKWRIEYVSDTHGYSVSAYDGRPSEPAPDEKWIGKKSINAYLGSYCGGIKDYFFEIGVSVYFGFDEDSKLIDIAVRKDADSL